MISVTLPQKSSGYKAKLIESNVAADNTILLYLTSTDSPFILNYESNNSITKLTVHPTQVDPILIEDFTTGTTNRTTHILNIDNSTITSMATIKLNSGKYSILSATEVDDYFEVFVPAGGTLTLFGTLVNNKIYFNQGSTNTIL